MSSILDISKKVESHQVNRVGGASSTISFKHRDPDNQNNFISIELDVKAFVEQSDKRKENTNLRQDEQTFYSVHLTEGEPARKDVIIFESKEWHVDEWGGNNPYDIKCVSNTRFIHTRRR